MLESKQKGIITELQCLTYFSQYGFNVCIPYGENSKYDFIIDVNHHLLRIQVKTCNGFLNSDGQLAGIEFFSKSTHSNTNKTVTKYYTSEDIDYFATFWEDNVYLVPVNECSSKKRLWFVKPKGNNSNSCIAKNYTLEKQLLQYCENFEFLKRQDNLTKTFSIIKK